jgi:hypothetical protein
MTNSKLEKSEKAELKVMREMLARDGGYVFSFPDRCVTIAIKPALRGAARCKTSNIAMAVCNPNEMKFRRTVGEYAALQRLYDGQFMTVPIVDFPASFANELANLFYN